jgi:two-component system, NtrC family, response regulator HydG
MQLNDLDMHELLALDTKQGGIIRFAGQRAIILDTVALGLLRLELIETLGMQGARGVLTRFGYAHGRRTAESLKSALPWDDEHSWRVAGGRLHTLQGLVVSEAMPASDGSFAEVVWKDSYEAEQHLLLLGRSDEAVCWTLTGFASGYLSFANGHDIYALEVKCRGKGDAVCQMVARPPAEWGDEIAPHLPFYEKACVDAQLERVTGALKVTERKLRTKQKELARVFGVEEDDDSSGLVARSEGMRRVLEMTRRVGGTEATALITGESGVGKERLARLLHDESTRAARPFVAINLGAVPEALLESELFGHARGAFTGATQDRPGLFESASGGTLFLDEVGELPLAMQVKLLRALQEREVRRVGENKSRPIDVRIVAATNRDLAADVVSGRYRQDLYYRLRVIELKVPPLRERKDDILPLARRFLAEAAPRLGRKVTGFTPEAAQQLLRHGWPGNVRELQNAIEHAVVLAGGERVGVDDLPDEIRAHLPTPVAVNGQIRALEEVEREYILGALAAANGNKTRAAQQLKIGIATLHRKLKQYGRP